MKIESSSRSRATCASRSRTTSGRACSPKPPRRDQIFLARDDLSLVPIPARSRPHVDRKAQAKMLAHRASLSKCRSCFSIPIAPPWCTTSPTSASSKPRALSSRSKLGMKLTEMAETQRYPVVVRTEIDYRRAAKLGDRLVVEGWLDRLERVRFWCGFQIKRPADGTLIADMPADARRHPNAGGETAPPPVRAWRARLSRQPGRWPNECRRPGNPALLSTKFSSRHGTASRLRCAARSPFSSFARRAPPSRDRRLGRSLQRDRRPVRRRRARDAGAAPGLPRRTTACRGLQKPPLHLLDDCVS